MFFIAGDPDANHNQFVDFRSTAVAMLQFIKSLTRISKSYLIKTVY